MKVVQIFPANDPDVRASTNCTRQELNWMVDHAKEQILGLVE